MQQVSNTPLLDSLSAAPVPDPSVTTHNITTDISSWPAPSTPPAAGFVTPSTPQYKRERDGADQHQQSHPLTPVVPQQPVLDAADASGGKRSRLNTYQAPRQVPSTLISAMGSLVGGHNHTEQSNTSVGMRRNLSGGFLEQYLGGTDDHTMEEEPPSCQSRVRSMSF